MHPNALSTLIHTFPATIRDAITLVAKLQLRCFWLDSLCLIQDDVGDLKLGIKNIDMVFYTFTIRLRLVPSRSGFFRDKDLYDANGTLCRRVMVDIPVSDPNCLGSCERPWPDVQITPLSAVGYRLETRR